MLPCDFDLPRAALRCTGWGRTARAGRRGQSSAASARPCPSSCLGPATTASFAVAWPPPRPSSAAGRRLRLRAQPCPWGRGRVQAQAREPPGRQRAARMQRALPRQVPLATVQVAALARQRAVALRADQSYLNCY